MYSILFPVIEAEMTRKMSITRRTRYLIKITNLSRMNFLDALICYWLKRTKSGLFLPCIFRLF
jgi:hypothetical protein